MFLSGEARSLADGSDLPSYNSEHVEKNQVGDRGCKGLSRGNWPSLLTICLGDNKLEEKGLAHLSKAEWGEVNRFQLSKKVVT